MPLLPVGRVRHACPAIGTHYPRPVITRTCLCLIERTRDTGREILLGYKKTGFGNGRWVGLGGHIEPGEDPVAAAVREVAEEAGLVVRPSALVPVASLTFRFPARPAWDQTAEVFLTAEFAGQPRESAEVAPRWFAVAELPFGQMWDDAAYWLPRVLAGDHVRAEIVFAADCATVAAITACPELTATAARPAGQPPADQGSSELSTNRPGTSPPAS